MPPRTNGRPARGGSDSARDKGLVGIVVHVTPDERRLLGMAAEAAGVPLKEFVRLKALSCVGPEIRKIP
jgi:hypothetical protein